MKRTLSLLLALMLLVSAMDPMILSAKADGIPTISFGSIEAAPGGQAVLDLSISGNPGIAGLVVSLEYDSDTLTLTNVTNGTVFPSLTKGGNYVWDNSENCTSDGTLATFTFDIAEGAAPGNYAVRAIVRDCVNEEYDDVFCSTAEGTVTVKAIPVPATSISLNQAEITLLVGETETLVATIDPSNSTDSISWSSSNSDIAAVDETGKVTAVSLGEAIITVSTDTVGGSKTASCAVTVACGHSEKTEVPAKSPTCFAAGNNLYYTCNACGAAFKADGITLTTAETETLAMAHSFTAQVEDGPYLVANSGADCQHLKQYYGSCIYCGEASNAESDIFDGTTYGPHKLSDTWSTANGQHYHICTVAGCDYTTDIGNCSGGNATCLELAVCEDCGEPYGELGDHVYSTEWNEGNAEGHWHNCSICSEHDTPVPHTPNRSEATEQDAIVCTDCGYIIHDKLPHTHIVTEVTGSEATLSTDGMVTHYECACGEWFLDAECKDPTNEEDCIIAHVASITLSQTVFFADGMDKTPIITVLDRNGNALAEGADYTIIFSTEDRKEIGIYSVTVKGTGRYSFTDTQTFEITVANGLWCADIPDQVYTGAAIKPILEVYCDGILLIPGEDYTVTYGKNNTNVASKDAMRNGKSIAPSVTITGKGNYSGKQTVNFSIIPRELSAVAKVDDITVAKTAKAVAVKPVVKMGVTTLKAGKDYVVSVTTDASGAITTMSDSAKLYIVGKGNYSGYVPFTFTVTTDTLISKVTIAKISNQQYDSGNEIKPVPTIMYNKKDVTDCFNIFYYDNTEIGTATAIITAKAGSGFAGSKTVTFKITGVNISFAKLGADGRGSIAPFIYSGEACEPELDLYAGTIKLSKGEDYSVVFSNNINAGTATVTVTGIGSYTGSKIFKFKINKYDAGTDEAGLISINQGDELSMVYEKGGAMPKPVITMGSTVLSEKTDYTLSYTNQNAVAGIDAAKAPTVTIRFTSNLSGTKVLKYTITKKDIASCTVSAADLVVSSKVNGWKQTKIGVLDTNGKKLTAGVDYDKVIRYYSDSACLDEISAATLPVGTTVYVKITGMQNYDGAIVGSYRIGQKSITSVKAFIAAQVYSGKEICPPASAITVTLGTGKNLRTLVADTDYEVVPGSYINNVSKGKASVTIRGLGDYCGTKVISFTIQRKNLLWWDEMR